MQILYTTQCCSTTWEVIITTALYWKHWIYLPGSMDLYSNHFVIKFYLIPHTLTRPGPIFIHTHKPNKSNVSHSSTVWCTQLYHNFVVSHCKSEFPNANIVRNSGFSTSFTLRCSDNKIANEIVCSDGRWTGSFRPEMCPNSTNELSTASTIWPGKGGCRVLLLAQDRKTKLCSQFCRIAGAKLPSSPALHEYSLGCNQLSPIYHTTHCDISALQQLHYNSK